MIRLIGKYSGKDACVIMGGQSILEYLHLFKNLDRDRFAIFLEAKALTPELLSSGIKPDFLLAPYPEKCKDNSLQNYIYRSFLAGLNIKPYLKSKHKQLAKEMKTKFNKYFETWRPQKGVHKRYKYKKDIYLQDSPYDLLQKLPKLKIITNKKGLEQHYPSHNYPNKLYYLKNTEEVKAFDFEKYFNPEIIDDELVLGNAPFFNSAAIVTYPLMKVMGFKNVYLFGMDMTVFGSMEYSAPFIFKSMIHFQIYFRLACRAFNANYKMNKPYYYRPESEFQNTRSVLNYSNDINICRIYKNNKYTAPLTGIKTVNPDDFFQKYGGQGK